MAKFDDLTLIFKVGKVGIRMVIIKVLDFPHLNTAVKFLMTVHNCLFDEWIDIFRAAKVKIRMVIIYIKFFTFAT